MEGHSLHLLTDIGLGIIFATGAAHVARLLRQPLIVGYVVGGILLGTHLGFGLVRDEASVELISEIGLILLLFIIGLEIDLRELVKMGKAMFALGFIQFVGCVALGMAVFKPSGFRLGGGNFDLLYLAVALALSSTLIVVKLLHDKFETGTTAGRLTIGVLVLQDIWAIIFMAFQPNLLDPHLVSILQSFAQGAVLISLSFLASMFLLARLFSVAAKSPELVLLTATAWCFLICGLAEKAGLSKEMGALIAGMSIAAFPYGADVIAKLGGVRDFFVTLFFVSLGLKVPLPTPAVLAMSAAIAAFVFASRILTLAPAAGLLGTGLRTALVTSVNLSQISEFSLVIVSLGAGYGHVTPELQALVLTAMLLAALVSTYMIKYNDAIARRGLGLAIRIGLGDSETPDLRAAEGNVRDIVVLGYFREGRALLDRIDHYGPAMKERVMVVDYNPEVRGQIEAQGFQWVYGDLANPQTLHHLGIEKASFVVCSLSDTFLKGTTNLRLLAHLKHLAPHARLVMTADDGAQAAALIAAGAYDAVAPSALAGTRYFSLLRGLKRSAGAHPGGAGPAPGP